MKNIPTNNEFKLPTCIAIAVSFGIENFTSTDFFRKGRSRDDVGLTCATLSTMPFGVLEAEHSKMEESFT